MPKRRQTRGFSLVDLLIVFAIIGVTCSLALPAYSLARKDIVDSRLQADVDTVNYAIGVFRSKGGRLEGLTDANAILTQLKNHRSHESSGLVQFLGAADQMIDPRLMARIQTKKEEESDCSRAVWDPKNSCFYLDTKDRGVKEFFIGRG